MQALTKQTKEALVKGHDMGVNLTPTVKGVKLPQFGVLATPEAHTLLRGGVPQGILTIVAKGEHPDFNAFLDKTPFFKGNKKRPLRKVAIKAYGHLYGYNTTGVIIDPKERREVENERALQKAARDMAAQAAAQKKHAERQKASEEAFLKRLNPRARKQYLARKQNAIERQRILDEEDKTLFENAIVKEMADSYLKGSKRGVGRISFK